eukprot:TRINITY_DN21742_c0_g1_i2.p1 TRINITY_DN21742_c0_g1~~TRINITY_DN21742_c0_g1_i2.p1  ORF type:complete len:477 (-),score=82.36 TRINITY_DN21742_c0_g1_i2:86-1516(-)
MKWSVAVSVACSSILGGAVADVQYSDSAFVHLFEWSWVDIAKECEEHLGPKGYTAVQISPPSDHIAGDAWWTRYQPVTYEIISRSGNEAEFVDMVSRCKAVGVGIYADAVINHVAGGSGKSIAGKSYGNRATPIYSQDEIHHTSSLDTNCQVNNYADKHNVQYCDLVGLPDLCTSCDSVQNKVSSYINHMSDLGIAGFRVDAAKHQDAGELGAMLSKVKGSLFRFHEVISGGGEAVKPDMYFSIGHVAEFDYARKLVPNILDEGKLQYLDSFGESWGLMPAQHAVVFLDNHDTQRGEARLTYKNGKLYEFANIFMLAHPYGYPKVMSSYYFSGNDQGPPAAGRNCGGGPTLQSSMNSTDSPWVCEHRWTAIANMVNWRKSAGSNGVGKFQKLDGNNIAFCRGSAACITMNRGSSQWSGTVKFSVPPGSYCNIIQSDDPSSCQKITVGSDGSAAVQVPVLSAVAVHIGKKAAEVTIV